MLTEKEIEIFTAVKEGNPYYFNVVLTAGNIMIDRVKKYSGKYHPYFNFAELARLLKMPMDKTESLLEVMQFYRMIKVARMSASGGQDFEDESTLDTMMDEINYLILKTGIVRAGLTPEEVLPPIEEEKDNGHMTVSIDFDGVLNEFRGWTGQYEQYGIKENAKEFVERLAKNFRLVILTARPTWDLPNVVEWLREHDMLQYFASVSNIKEPAIVYIDDRGYRFDGHYHLFHQWKRFNMDPYWKYITDDD